MWHQLSLAKYQPPRNPIGSGFWRLVYVFVKLHLTSNTGLSFISSCDTPGRPLIKGLGWKTIEELISYESKIMVFKSLNELAP